MFKIRLKLKLKLEYHTISFLSLDDHNFKGQIVFYYSKGFTTVPLKIMPDQVGIGYSCFCLLKQFIYLWLLY